MIDKTKRDTNEINKDEKKLCDWRLTKCDDVKYETFKNDKRISIKLNDLKNLILVESFKNNEIELVLWIF